MGDQAGVLKKGTKRMKNITTLAALLLAAITVTPS
jgi:hypothetical protein